MQFEERQRAANLTTPVLNRIPTLDSGDSSTIMVTRLRDGLPRNLGSIPATGKRFISTQNVHNARGAHPAYQMGASDAFRRGKVAES